MGEGQEDSWKDINDVGIDSTLCGRCNVGNVTVAPG